VGDAGRHGSEGGPPRPRWLVPGAALAGWLVFAGYLMVQARAGPAIIWNDSEVYIHMAQKGLGSRALWAGPRPPVLPLLIKAVGSSDAFLTVQAAVAAVAWGVLAWTVARLMAPGWRRVTAVWVVLAFAGSFPLTLWNRSVLSESLSLSLMALLLAALIWTTRAATWPRIGATLAAGLVFAATRDAQVWTVAMLALAVGVRAAVVARGRRPWAARLAVLSAGLAGVVVVTGWGTATSHRTPQNVADVLDVRVFPYPARVAWFAAHGMPEAARIDALARATAVVPGQAPVVYTAPSDRTFAPLEHWVATRATGVYLLWLVTHPGYVIAEPLVRPERSYNFAQGSLTAYASSTDRDASPLTVVMWPPLIGLLILAAVAGYCTVLARGWRDPVWRTVLVFTGIGIPAMLVAWHGDGQEVTRHTLEGLAQFRLGVWILVLLWLLESGRPGTRSARNPGTESLPATADGGRQGLEHGHRRLPADAGIGHALPEDQGAGPRLLAARDQEALQHQPDDPPLAGGDPLADLGDHHRLAAMVLPAVAVAGVDEETWG